MASGTLDVSSGGFSLGGTSQDVNYGEPLFFAVKALLTADGGTIADKTGNSFTNTGSVGVTNTPVKFSDNSIDFSPASSSKHIDLIESLADPNSTYTFEAFVYINSVPTNGHGVFFNGTSSQDTSRSQLDIRPDGTVAWLHQSPVYAASSANSTTSPLRGDSGNFYTSQGIFADTFAGNFVRNDFGVAVPVDEVRYRNTVGSDWAPTQVLVQSSNDDTNWTTEATYNDNATTSVQTISVTSGTSARYWRIYQNTGTRQNFNGYQWHMNSLSMTVPDQITLQSASTISTGAWHHVAIVQDSGARRLYVDGNYEGTNTFLTPITSPSTFLLGQTRLSSALQGFDGYMDQVRLTEGFARYTTSSFTVPLQEYPDSFIGDIEAFAPGEFSLSGSTVTVSAPGELDALPESFSFTPSSVTVSAPGELDALPEAFNFTGASNSAQIGRILDSSSESFSFQPTSQALSGPGELDVSTESFSFTAASTELLKAATLDGSTESFSLAGTSQTLAAGLQVNVNTDTFTFSEPSQTLAVDYKVNTVTTSFDILGTATPVIKDSVIALTTDSFTIAEGDATLQPNYPFNSIVQSYTFTGASVFFEYGQKNFDIQALQGFYLINGSNVELIRGYSAVQTTPTTYSLGGSSQQLQVGNEIITTSGTFNFAPSSTDLVFAAPKELNIETGTFSISGSAVQLKDPLLINSASFSLSGTSTEIFPTRFTTQPVDRSVEVGKTATFSVTAQGQGGTNTGSFQWYISPSTIVSGATGSVLVIGSTQSSQDGNQYFARYTDESGAAVDSSLATLTVATAPTITVQPVAQNVNLGATVNLTVTATGDVAYGALTYQWRRNGNPITGETGTTLTITGVTPNGSATYDVEVSNNVTSTVSDSVLVETILPPIILSQPVDTSVFELTTATFTVVAVSNVSSTTLTYQWYQTPSTLLAGETNPTLSLTSVPLTDSGNEYYCIIDNNGLTTTSDTAALTVNSQTLKFTKQPIDAVISETATSATFSVLAVGSGSISYQWYNGLTGTSIPGETSSVLTVNQPFTSGDSYYVVVTDTIGSIQSRTVEISVVPEDLYSFRLPAAYGGQTVVVDKAVTGQATPRIFDAEFGDGYAQKVPAGLENIEEQWTITLANRPAELIDRVGLYFESLGNIQAFNFTISNTLKINNKETITVQCTEFNISYVNPAAKTLTATLRRTYEYLPPEAVV